MKIVCTTFLASSGTSEGGLAPPDPEDVGEGTEGTTVSEDNGILVVEAIEVEGISDAVGISQDFKVEVSEISKIFDYFVFRFRRFSRPISS